MEDTIYCDKPSRNESYFKSLQLKVKTHKILQRYGCDSQKEKWNNCNFKKNTGFKPIYSCHGYGGRCGMCRNREDESHLKTEQIKRTARDDLKEWKISSNF